MDFRNAYFSFEDRRREKQVSRDADSRALRSGSLSEFEVARKNDFFANLDVENYRLTAIGPRRVLSRR